MSPLAYAIATASPSSLVIGGFLVGVACPYFVRLLLVLFRGGRHG